MRYRTVKTCKAEGCEAGVTSRSKLGYCRQHRHKARPKQPFDLDRWQSWLEANPEHPERFKAARREWANKNPQSKKVSDCAYQKRRRSKQALQALQALRPELKANIARVKQEFENRGYLGNINVEYR